ncbi:MAG TPA: hypothetical protein VIM73_10195 [Polyangiaceae bacterium]
MGTADIGVNGESMDDESEPGTTRAETLGPSGPLLRALGLGFAIGCVVMGILALLS